MLEKKQFIPEFVIWLTCDWTFEAMQ